MKDGQRQLNLRHGERLAALDEYLREGQHSLALEYMRRILGDPKIPAEVRITVRAKEVDALLGLNRPIEAYVAAKQVEALIGRHRLFHLEEAVAPALHLARQKHGA